MTNFPPSMPKAPFRSVTPCRAAVLVAVGTSVLLPRDALAYVDPASGSILLQVLAAGALAAAFTVRRTWTGVKLFMRSIWGRVRGKR